VSDSALNVIVISAEHVSNLPGVPIVSRCSLHDDHFPSQRVLEPLSPDSDFWTADWRTNLLAILEEHSIDNMVGYVVPGHPMLGDATVEALIEFDARDDINLELYDEPLPVVLTELLTLSSGPPVFIDGLTLIERSCSSPFDSGTAPFNSSQSTIISSVSPARTGEFITEYCSRFYRNSTEVRLIPMTGELEQIVLTLDQVSNEASIHPHYLVVAPSFGDEYQRTSHDLQRIVARLRAPGGCTWDREQTNQSLAKGLIEESYELLDALERGNRRAIREEMGDFLLQAYMHTQITAEHDEMTFEDVVQTLIDKLVRRHPHVFATATADTSDAVVQSWDDIKRAERAKAGRDDSVTPLGDIPASLPALLRLQTVLKRAKRTSLDNEQLRDASESTSASLEDEHDRELIDRLVETASEAQENGVDLEHLLRSWTRRYEHAIIGAFAEREPAD
jgi:tetrapyrrole methylase family protein / MazG family protein